MASDVKNHPLYRYEGSVNGIRTTFTNKKFKKDFISLAKKNSWEEKIESENYVLRTKKGAYVIQSASDHAQGKNSGCLIPSNFKSENITSDDTPETREAVSRIFKTIRMGQVLKSMEK